MTHSVEVTIRPDGTELVIDLPVAIIEGRVSDSEGRPLRGIEVSVRGDNRSLVNVIMPDGATMHESGSWLRQKAAAQQQPTGESDDPSQDK